MKAKVWEEDIIIPTYEIGMPEKNPMFLERRIYQGSSGVVYPYPVIEKISDEKIDKRWHAIFLENEYLKIMILPELGGRVQMAYDKIKERHFIYYNSVIKPALVGLTGPWVSGGIEFNWPQHHRPSTYLPVDFSIEEKEDGSATVWINEQERMFHQKATVAFTLYPGRAYLEIRGTLFNPTPIPQTFLWWANPAVKVNDNYQSVFPPDVNAVFDHGKRDVSNFPIATGTYYKVDYSAGVDISRYKNIPVPTSYMAIKSKYNFMGGYEHDTKAGVLHVANHHISPGKKQWTWGNGDFGRAWDRNLTDSDGPYIELMTGVYTDNQPDFSWLQPYEEKSFVQYFMPYRELGLVKNACTDLLMNLEEDKGNVVLKLLATRDLNNAAIVLKVNDEIAFEDRVSLSPKEVYEKTIVLKPLKSLSFSAEIYSETGKKILSWTPEKETIKPLPQPAQRALPPAEVKTTEQLYLTGLHIEQYRHATYKATDYYGEALRRDPSDLRNNNAMGLWLFRKGKFAEAVPYFRRAIETLTSRNPNPYDGEPYYNLGLALKLQGENEEAYESFYKACWNAAWQDAGFYSLAQLSIIDGRWHDAEEEIEKSLIRNWHNHRARHLKTAILRHKGKIMQALKWSDESLEIDRFNFGCLFEQYLITNYNTTVKEFLLERMRQDSHNYEEIALDYIQSGLYDEAVQLLQLCIDEAAPSPMTYYYQAWAYQLLGKINEAQRVFESAAQQSPDYCFPNRLEAILALQTACNENPKDAYAPYYLGNLWYDKLQYDNAIACWELSASINPDFPTVLRNLALAAFNKGKNIPKAVSLLEKAYRLDENDARILMELDQLRKRLNYPHAERLSFLEARMKLVLQRDDLYLEYATLLNQLGHYEEAKAMIDKRKFHPWEGGEGKATGQYVLCRLELAKKAIAEKKYKEAVELLNETDVYPVNLGEGKLFNAEENEINYYKGIAYKGLGDTAQARESFLKATVGSSEPVQAFFYNDQQPDKIFYQGLAWRELGDENKAKSRFNKLIAHGEKHLFDECKIDYFAVSLPDLAIWDDDLNVRNKIHCYYVMALGYSGLGQEEKAETYYQKVKKLDINKYMSKK
jgi:tetratricopeptide (TPR) repeat protein